jgi:hypothetical protein
MVHEKLVWHSWACDTAQSAFSTFVRPSHAKVMSSSNPTRLWTEDIVKMAVRVAQTPERGPPPGSCRLMGSRSSGYSFSPDFAKS